MRIFDFTETDVLLIQYRRFKDVVNFLFSTDGELADENGVSLAKLKDAKLALFLTKL